MLSSRKFAQHLSQRSVGRQPLPAISGNHACGPRPSASARCAFDVLHHRKAQRIGVDAGIARDRRSPAASPRWCASAGIPGYEPSPIFPFSCSRVMMRWCVKVAQPSFIILVWRCG